MHGSSTCCEDASVTSTSDGTSYMFHNEMEVNENGEYGSVTSGSDRNAASAYAWERNSQPAQFASEYRSLRDSIDIAPSLIRQKRGLDCLALVQLPKKCTNVDTRWCGRVRYLGQKPSFHHQAKRHKQAASQLSYIQQPMCVQYVPYPHPFAYRTGMGMGGWQERMWPAQFTHQQFGNSNLISLR